MALSDWMNSRLSELLDFPVPQDLTEYIVAIENPRDLEEYLRNLLNFNEPKHRQFFEELKQRRYSAVMNASSDVQGYKKPDVGEVYYQPKQNDKKKKNKAQSPEIVFQKEKVVTQEEKKTPEEKKKKKFVNLYSLDGQMREAVMLRGRHECNCQATKHKLVANCLECGRIVCEQEGFGPCFFCGNFVLSAEQKKNPSLIFKEGDTVSKTFTTLDKSELESAIKQRNKLLEYDQTSEKRTKVIDDESDYYSSNSVWLSQKERQKRAELEEEIISKKQSSRFNKKITLDFAGRQVVEDSGDVDDIEEMTKRLLENEGFSEETLSYNVEGSLHPRIICEKPMFQDPGEVQKKNYRNSNSNSDAVLPSYRLQDKEFLEMSDQGVCLSMHQPWASLLVVGIKKHEGRVWYHSHRGRLWIAATAKQPDKEEVKNIERTYDLLGYNVKFPSLYPTGCLLGCVSVVDCLPQEEYRIKYPDGESDSPFVFICEEPKELPIKFPIQGKHKIYKLEKKIHEAASKSLEHVARIRSRIARGAEQ